MKVFTIVLIFILMMPSVKAQKITIGPEFGFNSRNDMGVNIMQDSLIVTADGNVGNNENIFGLFVDYQLSDLFNIHTAIGYTFQINGYLIYNRYEDFGFPPVVKAVSVGSHNINLLMSIQYKLVEIKGVRISLTAGFRPNFLINTQEEPIEFGDGSRHQGAAEIINNMDNTNKNIYVTSSVGAQISYWRLHLKASYDFNLPNSSYTEKLDYFDSSHEFYNRTYVTSISLRYDLFRIKSE